MSLNQTNNNYYDLVYHLAEVSAFKLNQQVEEEGPLRRQLLVRNMLILSSNIILSTQQVQQTKEEVWFNACFDELEQEEEEEDIIMEEKQQQDNLLVVAFPFTITFHH